MKAQIDQLIPVMDTPEKVYQLFESLGYKVLGTHLKTSPSVYNLPTKEAALVEKIFAVANYDRRFQILLFKFKAEGPEQSRREAIRTIPEKILREVDFPFIIFTPDFKTYTFTLVEKVREGPGEFKRKLTKLVIDRAHPYHTDKEILESLLHSPDITNPVDIHKLFQNAFSVERVTKKFFTEYREVFEQLVEEVTKQNKHLKFTLFSRDGSIENFVKILLGRLMFLYFIQKRGWLNCFDGWGSGDKKFLYSKFQEAKREKKNYFKDYLEPLFFDTLNNPRRDKPDQATQFGGRIPFLNGGLFEPEYDYQDVRNHIILENSTFDQVFAVFEKYNFTVKEDEPLEKEVAIDPEMLGKVFENLLEENLRKGKGTYYTPREIVHYMCHESLVNYLASEVGIEQEEIRNFLDREQSLEKKETLSPLIRSKAKEIDEKLADIKVLDSACGSGAFLVGMLHEIINARLGLNRELGKNKSEYEFKKEAIQNNLYGVDIDPGAVEIAKLRLWLSLVVDHNLPEIEPLPNLDYKIMIGNSLIELLNPTLLSKTTDQDRNKLIDELNRSKEIYATTFDLGRKKELREKINSLVQALANYDQKKVKDKIWEQLLGFRGQTPLFDDQPKQASFGDIENKLSKKLEELEKLKDVTTTDHFEWHLNFNEVFNEKGGFDVVIANPPYVRADAKDPKYQDFRRSLETSGLYKTLYEKWDLFIPFIERGLNLLNSKGNLDYIVSNAVCTSKYAFKLLYLIQQEYFIVSIDYFEDMQVFEAGVIPVVLHICKDPINQPVRKIIRNGSFKNVLSEQEYKSEDFKILGRLAFKKDYHAINIKIPIVNLRDICYMSVGMVINADEKKAKGEFTKDDLISDVKTNIHIKRYIEGKDIEKYQVNRSRYLEWNTSRVPKKLRRPTFPNLYDRPKIMRGRVTEGIYDDSGLVCNDSIVLFVRFTDLKGVNNNSIAISVQKFNSSLRGELEKVSNGFDLKYLLAILNSRFANVFLNNIRRHRLENYFYPDDFRNLPIAEIPLAEQKSFADLVDKITILKKSDSEKDKQQAIDYERRIDQLVYKLYGLTPEEIDIVETSV